MEGWGCGEWSELKAGMQGVDWGVEHSLGGKEMETSGKPWWFLVGFVGDSS